MKTESLKNYVIIAKTASDFSQVPNTSRPLEGYRESTLPSYFTVYKCLTFDMPKVKEQKVKLASIVFSNNLFPNGFVPSNDQLLSNFHLPNEMLANALATKWTWTERSQSRTKCLQIRFTIKSMTILRRRNKVTNVCKRYENFDEDFKEAIITKFGCIPPYWKSNLSFGKCKSAKDLEMVAKYVFEGYSGGAGAEKLTLKKCIELKW